MKKHIANIVTGARMVFSLPLLFIPLSWAWFFVYLICGLTDMIDGTIARKTGSAGKFGARLDTASDFVFMLVCGVRILPLLRLPVWLWVCIIIVALIKLFNITLVFIRKKKLISIHSLVNKITGVALFLLPPSLAFVEATYSVAIICVLATTAAVQEVFFVEGGREIV